VQSKNRAIQDFIVLTITAIQDFVVLFKTVTKQQLFRDNKVLNSDNHKSIGYVKKISINFL